MKIARRDGWVNCDNRVGLRSTSSGDQREGDKTTRLSGGVPVSLRVNGKGRSTVARDGTVLWSETGQDRVG